MIEYRNNGKIFYTPQVKTNIFSVWHNIIDSNNISKLVRVMYDDVTEAKNEIDNYLINLDTVTGKKVKRVEYIPVG